MKEYFKVLTCVGLFKGVSESELEAMLTCLGAEIRRYSKDEMPLLAGETPRYIGIVLSGLLHIVREDADGNRSMLAALETRDIFAEALCCAGVKESPVTVIAGSNSIVMKLEFSRILKTCSNSCTFHTKLIENMLKLIATKNLMLQNRMEIVGSKTIRDKVMRYLRSLSPKQTGSVTLPFNREELADYLCVERSALSHELSKMKDAGLIEYKKNKFVIKQ